MDFVSANKVGAMINFDDITHISKFYEKNRNVNSGIVFFRYNPKNERKKINT